jgi:hypothetical protein
MLYHIVVIVFTTSRYHPCCRSITVKDTRYICTDSYYITQRWYICRCVMLYESSINFKSNKIAFAFKFTT